MHTHRKQLVRLTTDNIVNDQIQVRDAMSFGPSGKVLLEDFAEIQKYTTSSKFSQLVIRKEIKSSRRTASWRLIQIF